METLIPATCWKRLSARAAALRPSCTSGPLSEHLRIKLRGITNWKKKEKDCYVKNKAARCACRGRADTAELYVEALTSQDMGAELTAICDIDPNLAERVPQIRQRQIPVYLLWTHFLPKTAPIWRCSYRRCISIPIWGTFLPGAWRERFVKAALPDRKGSRRHAGSQ